MGLTVIDDWSGDPAIVTPCGFKVICWPGAAARLMLFVVADLSFTSLRANNSTSKTLNSQLLLTFSRMSALDSRLYLLRTALAKNITSMPPQDSVLYIVRWCLLVLTRRPVELPAKAAWLSWKLAKARC